ncbi:hypothetical protein HYFRA_00011277 [Hymenoscyphus fraxineus]|uniref:SMODS and SLOG-associating 2TM effector domain-containing protein n=1 Tax=Hymenoscyphus fraxineus TaxID=746836 RepID=A0A9N9PTK2_9HELO|nr:hypothetical protein HYFRA_00011277 [Hymenoscyphus fraxineus]
MSSASTAGKDFMRLTGTPPPSKLITTPSPVRTIVAGMFPQPSASFSPNLDGHGDEKGSGDRITISVQNAPEDSQFSQFPETTDDPLKTFHTALGIPPPKPAVVKTRRNLLFKKKPHPNPPPQPKISGANKGVYNKVLFNERNSRYVYNFCDWLLTVCMFLQIIVGAAVTALGAGNSSNVIVTVFGATNTALASLLAVMKSKGLPNRLRQDWNGWRELREYIEEKEREIEFRMQGHGGGLDGFDIWALVREIEARYQTMRLTLEANRPDTYIKVPPMQLLPK